MTAGIAVAYANPALDTIGTAAAYAQLHTGNPGAAGTANVSSVTTRQAVTWNSASGAQKTLSGTAAWGAWAGTSPETVTYVSLWTAVSGGTFVASVQLPGGGATFTTGDVATLSSLILTLAPVAA